MPINKDLPLGGVHIRLPFNSMDDVSFSGAYGGLADKLVEKLREHLQETGGEPNPEDDDDSDEDLTHRPLPHQVLPNANNQ